MYILEDTRGASRPPTPSPLKKKKKKKKEIRKYQENLKTS